MNERGETGEGLPRIGFTLLGGYLMLCAMIIPHMYSSGYAGSGRVINMYHSYVLLFAPVVCMMALARVRPEKRAALAAGRGKIACFALAAAALAVANLAQPVGIAAAALLRALGATGMFLGDRLMAANALGGIRLKYESVWEWLLLCGGLTLMTVGAWLTAAPM